MGYLGSKAASGAYQAIISQMLPHDTYIETHLGGGTIMRRKPPSSQSIGIDIDPEPLANFTCNYKVSLHNQDAVEFLKGFDFTSAGRVLIYADPPYLHETRSTRTRYRYEYSTEDHKTLIKILRKVPARVMLSSYPSVLYADLLFDWRKIEFQAMTRGGVRTEQLWMNYEPEAAHWAVYAGKNFTDRQRIKRKAMRWKTNYARLPYQERLAILSAMLEVN